MPVIAKLSRAVYEKLGDEVTNQLVDWVNQVHTAHTNEVNFARLEAKLELRVTELRTFIITELGRLAARLEATIGAKAR